MNDLYEIGDLVVIVSKVETNYYKRLGVIIEVFNDTWEIVYNVRFGFTKDDNYWYKKQQLLKLDPKYIGSLEIQDLEV